MTRCLYLISAIVLLINYSVVSQPYFDTHVENPHVKNNVFLHRIADSTAIPVFSDIKNELPQPEWPARPDVLKCYWKAWELAFKNLHKPAPRSGFISPFIDPAFNGHIFMWDSHFMMMFGRYGSRAFDFQQTLDNFYAKQHKDGFICREIVESDGSDFFERFDVSSTGPNLFPWTEWEYYLNFGDTARLGKVFDPLLAYYQWYKAYRSWPDGSYYSSGWGCGMDNQPRLQPGYSFEWSNGKMSWIDITLQEILAAKILVKMAYQLHRQDDVRELEKEIPVLSQFVNEKMWDQKSSFYYDRFSDGSLSKVKSIASFWALLSGVIPAEYLNAFVDHLANPSEFSRTHRVATLSADQPDFNPEGGYWKGSIWAPTNYMVLRGLSEYGLDSLAFEIARNHVNNVVDVFSQTGTLFENYAPDKIKGNDRKDFVGWTGIVPITDLFEYVFGLRPDVPNHSLVLDVRLTDEYGVRNYPFGKEGLVDIHVAKRKDPKEMPNVIIKSNIEFDLNLAWAGGIISIHVTPSR
ncbi:MAG: glycoside hydrolase [Bacteroidetes bacterium]|nr:glycoside hydrolase [Bacteroidota bacterium]